MDETMDDPVEQKVMSEEEKKEAKKELLEEEIEAALEEELGHNWLEEKPAHIRVAVQFARLLAVLFALYFFLVSLDIMGKSFQAVSGQQAGELFAGQDNPLVGLMIGILATVLVQSSSTTTSIIVVLVANSIIEVQTAIPMIMGANIGTSVTNTIVSLGFADDTEAYRRGFAGATVHDMFNYLNVCLLLPIELIFQGIAGKGPLQAVAEGVTGDRDGANLQGDGAGNFKDANPVKKITGPIVGEVIGINKDVVTDYAQGFPDLSEVEDGVECEDEIPEEDQFFEFESEDNELPDECVETFCNFCPEGVFDKDVYDETQAAFDSARLVDGGFLKGLSDQSAGIVGLIISLSVMIFSLFVIVKNLTTIVQGSAKRILVKSLNYDFVGGGYLAILVGVGITFVVQSSSITTSILTPLVAVGALTVENMFPYTLGANIGTTGTGLIAAAASDNNNGYTIALVHLFFNIFGTLIWYPVPFIRRIPINAAKFLGDMAAIWKIVPILYILLAFIFYPLVFYGISAGLRSSNGGGVAVGVIVLLAVLAVHIYAIFWYRFRDGKNKFIAFVEARKARLAEKTGAPVVADGAAEEETHSV